jgi:hypothetical protein
MIHVRLLPFTCVDTLLKCCASQRMRSARDRRWRAEIGRRWTVQGEGREATPLRTPIPINQWGTCGSRATSDPSCSVHAERGNDYPGAVSVRGNSVALLVSSLWMPTCVASSSGEGQASRRCVARGRGRRRRAAERGRGRQGCSGRARGREMQVKC